MSSKVFGIDFGTNIIKIYRKGTGVIYEQRTALAEKNNKAVIAIGNAAYEMWEKSPEKITVTFPIKNGVIASFDKMITLLNCIFLDLSKEFGRIKGGTFYIAVSSDITDVEKKSFYDALDATFIKPKKIILIDKPICDCKGALVDVFKTQGTLIIDIGGSTSEVSVISNGGIIITKLLNFGSNTISDSLILNIRRKYNILIGPKTAEKVLEKMATFIDDGNQIVVFGRDVVSGLPIKKTINNEFVKQVMVENFVTLSDSIKLILERIPPEISAEIYDNGCYLCGGVSKINGIKFFFREKLKLKVNLVKDPIDSVINGLAEIIENPLEEYFE